MEATEPPTPGPDLESVEIERTYGPFEGARGAFGVAHDGLHLWVAGGDGIRAVDPGSGEVVGIAQVNADAGTAYDGRWLYQLSEGFILRVDPKTGTEVGRVPAPCQEGHSGMAWANGSLWIGEYRGGRIHRVDPATGEVQSVVQTQRYVTGIAWVGPHLWHGSAGAGRADVDHLDEASGQALRRLQLPEGLAVAGVAVDPEGRMYCAGGSDGLVRLISERALPTGGA